MSATGEKVTRHTAPYHAPSSRTKSNRLPATARASKELPLSSSTCGLPPMLRYQRKRSRSSAPPSDTHATT
jgi:hypothetical protein